MYREYLQRLKSLPVRHEAGEALHNLAQIEVIKGNDPEAERMLTEAINLFSQSLGEDYPSIGNFLTDMTELHLRRQDFAAAEASARRALEIFRQKFPADHALIPAGWGTLSKVLLMARQPQRAAPYLKEALEKYPKIPNLPRHSKCYAAGVLGECLTLFRRFEEAEKLLLENYHGLRPVRGEQSIEMRDARQKLVKLYEAWGKPELAQRLQTN